MLGRYSSVHSASAVLYGELMRAVRLNHTMFLWSGELKWRGKRLKAV